jgi:hypothetical protein
VNSFSTAGKTSRFQAGKIPNLVMTIGMLDAAVRAHRHNHFLSISLLFAAIGARPSIFFDVKQEARRQAQAFGYNS